MTRAPIADDGAAERLGRLIEDWSEDWFATGTLRAVEAATGPDRLGHHRWLLRLSGEEKDAITFWLTLRQRTVHVEVQVMPAPEESVAEVYRFLLARAADMGDLHPALGPEDAIYLVGRVPVAELTAERLDELVGGALRDIEEIFPTAMTLGFGSRFRRRRARG